MKIFKMAKDYLIKYRLYLLFFVVLNIGLWILTMITPYITGRYIDFLVESKDIKIIYYFTGTILTIEIFITLISYFNNILLIKFQNKSAFDLNANMLEHVKKLPLLYFKDLDSVYLNQRINSDSSTVISFTLNSLISIFIKSITFICALYLLFDANIKLTLILLTLIPLYLILYILFKKPLFECGFDLKEKKNKFFSKMNEQLFNIKFIKINSTFRLQEKKLRNNFTNVLRSLIKYSKISYLLSSCDLMIGSLSRLILFFFGGMEVINGRMTIGEFTIIGSYFSMLISCTSYFLKFGKSYQDALICYNRLSEILKVSQEHNGDIVIDTIDTIELKKVDFSYNKNKNLLHKYNYKFEKGKVYTIIGENGTGKSTLINLLMGLFNNNYKGKVYYNSIDINDLDLYIIRKKLMGLTQQEPTLINDTILANLTYGLNNVDKSVINHWCVKLNMYDFINNLPNGFNTNINEKSSNISGGEKQKISLAKIFIKSPEVIILDEPTSALDTEGKENLKNIIQEIKMNKIIIIITHSKEIMNISDEIINLSIGEQMNV